MKRVLWSGESQMMNEVRRAVIAALQMSMSRLGLKKIGKWRLLTVGPGTVTDLLVEEKRRAKEHWVAVSAESGQCFSPVREEENLVGFSQHEDVLVSANSRYSALIEGLRFVLAPSPSRSPQEIITSYPPVSGLLRFDDGELLVKAKTLREVPKALFVGSLSPHNWYHWIIDYLPSVYLAKFLHPEYHDYPLLVPEVVMSKPHWIEMLSTVIGNREIIGLSSDSYLHVRRLVWIHGPTTRLPRDYQDGTCNLAMEVELINEYRAFVLNRLGLSFDPEEPQSRLFLARPEGSLRPYNQDQIFSIAREFGFEPLYSERLTLRESIRSLLQAEYVVGPHGAGWANALFTERGRGSLIWTWDEGLRENWFHNVLLARGIQVKTISTGPGSNATPYTLDPATFREFLGDLTRN